MAFDVLEALRAEEVTVGFEGSRLEFTPEPSERLKPLLVAESRRLLRLGRMAEDRMAALGESKVDDLQRWARLHDKLCNRWLDDVQGYSLLVAWVGANRRRAEGYRKVHSKRSNYVARGSARADIRWNDELIDSLRARLLAASIVLPELHHCVMKLR